MITASLPQRQLLEEQSICRVGVIFKTHLDLGFTDLARNVFGKYMEEFMPRAVELALSHEASGAPFSWTTGSWLVAKYLDHSKGVARRTFEVALSKRLICWHALPFTFQTEALTPSMLSSALGISRRLDERFGFRTTAAKMTDVPGHCRGMVPVLADHGIQFLHIGVNPASPVPDVPPIFRWRHPAGAELVLCYDETYGGYCRVPGRPELFAVAMTGDNAGPPTAGKIATLYQSLSEKFPNAEIIASNLEEMGAAICEQQSSLPVFEGEIGDTWIHGYGSDPAKLATYRELCRLRERWMADGRFSPESRQGRKFDENLLMVAEHTWGLDEKTWMHSGQPLDKLEDCYERRSFLRARRREAFRHMEASWEEQRGYLRAAVEALPIGKLRTEAGEALGYLTGHPLVTDAPVGLKAVPAGDARLPTPSGSASVLTDGALCLTGPLSAVLGRLVYQVFGGRDCLRYLDQYLTTAERHGIWAPQDFGKTGLEKYLPEGRRWRAEIRQVKVSRQADALFLDVGFPEEAVGLFGAPGRIAITIRQTQEWCFEWELRWSKKTACRIPEAIWFSFQPKLREDAQWSLLKMGGPVDPTEVVSRGNRSLHFVHDGVLARDSDAIWQIKSLDAALVAPGKPSLLDFHNTVPNCTRDGIHFNLLNNVWGTNFPMWYEDDGFFRFSVQIELIDRTES